MIKFILYEITGYSLYHFKVYSDLSFNQLETYLTSQVTKIIRIIRKSKNLTRKLSYDNHCLYHKIRSRG